MVKRKSLVCIIMVSLAMIFGLVGCSKSSSKSSGSTDNIFSKMFTVKNDSISLKNIEFLMNKEDVIEKKQLNKDDLDVNTEEQIVKNITIENMTETAREIYEFQDDKLVSISTVMLIDNDKYGEACNEIYQQVKKVMPAANDSDIEDIKGGKKNVTWQSDNIRVTVSFPESDAKGKTILISGQYVR